MHRSRDMITYVYFQLKAELVVIQRAHAEAMTDLRSSRMAEVAEAEVEEVQRLREELKLREDEINAIRNELEEVQRAATIEDMGTDLGGDATSRAVTPIMCVPVHYFGGIDNGRPNIVFYK